MVGKLGPPVVPFLTLFGLGGQAPTKINYRKKGTLILTSLLEDLGKGFAQLTTLKLDLRQPSPLLPSIGELGKKWPDFHPR